VNVTLLSLLCPAVDAEDVAVARAVELAAEGKRVKFRMTFREIGGRQVACSIEAVEAV
jgi:hypothetical protein